jgi:hypothetical protein
MGFTSAGRLQRLGRGMKAKKTQAKATFTLCRAINSGQCSTWLPPSSGVRMCMRSCTVRHGAQPNDRPCSHMPRYQLCRRVLAVACPALLAQLMPSKPPSLAKQYRSAMDMLHLKTLEALRCCLGEDAALVQHASGAPGRALCGPWCVSSDAGLASSSRGCTCTAYQHLVNTWTYRRRRSH